MFRFVYALHADESFDPAAFDGFVGVECDGEPPTGATVVGRRFNGGQADDGDGAAKLGDAAYAVLPVMRETADVVGRRLAKTAGTAGRTTLMLQNGGAFTSAKAMWDVMEAARHPRVRLAIDTDAARAAGQTASVLVPTLNLRIGLIRVRSTNDELADYARRLAGIGFEGYVVIDPPAGGANGEAVRADLAREIAGVFRSIFPAKPVKKAPPAKAGVKKE